MLHARLRYRFLLFPVLLAFGDLGMTLRCQPAAYWDNYSSGAVIEANPLVRWAMEIHPLALIPGFVGWFAIVYLLLFFAPAWVAFRSYAILVFGHCVAIAGGFLRFFPHGFAWTCLLIFCVAPAATLIVWRYRSQWNAKSRLVDGVI